MGFMNSYKRLDNLCRDMNGIGVTGYIQDMERTPNGNDIPGWKEDYLQLKHYRHIRNQIAHQNDADEENMCSDGDAVWIENFYQRIMEQSDPLALSYKAARSRSADKPTETKKVSSKAVHKSAGCGGMILFALAVVTIILWILFS